MSDRKHEGWTNYETWAVNLWISNEESSHLLWSEAAQDHYEAAVSRAATREEWTEQAARALADQLKDTFEGDAEAMLEAGRGAGTVWADLLGRAQEEVNWAEVARSFVEGLDRDTIEADASL